MWRLVVLLVAACAGACAGERHWTLEEHRQRIADGTDEERYRATLGLDRFGEQARPDLERLLDSDDPMTRNAAARALCDIGTPAAARVLIDNLDRDRRTFVATDAIYHLRAVFGTGLGYDPNLGYRHQTEKQQEWWDWWAIQPFGGPVTHDDPDAERRALRRAALYDRLRAFEAEKFDTPEAEHHAIRTLWESLTANHSRHPDACADEEFAFGIFVARWPDNADLWNNLALAALNNGDYETAERSYLRALALRPRDSSLHNDLGILREGLGRLGDAEAHYREALRLDPTNDIAAANLADVLRERGYRDEAIALYRKAEKLAPDKWQYHRIWIRRMKPPRR